MTKRCSKKHTKWSRNGSWSWSGSRSGSGSWSGSGRMSKPRELDVPFFIGEEYSAIGAPVTKSLSPMYERVRMIEKSFYDAALAREAKLIEALTRYVGIGHGATAEVALAENKKERGEG